MFSCGFWLHRFFLHGLMRGDSKTSRHADDRAEIFGLLLRLDTAIAFLGISVIVIQQCSGRRQTIQSRVERF